MIEEISIKANHNVDDVLYLILDGSKSYAINVEHNAQAKIFFQSECAENNVELSVGEHASVKIYDYVLSSENIRNNFRVELNEIGASCEMKGIFVTQNHQDYINNIIMHHRAVNTHSDQNYKGIAQDSSCANFFSRVIVEENAQKISSNQSNKNLLLSNNATIRTKPELEIYADDVQCAHGATVGELDDNALFYLRTRGIPLARAKAMLTYAFIADNIDQEFAERLNPLVLAKIPDSDELERTL